MTTRVARATARAFAIAVLSSLSTACGEGQGHPTTAADLATKRALLEGESRGEPPRFIENDYAKALAEAKRTGRPLFVDAWAPWCHSCLSMREYVLNDAALAPIANDFVWLAVDTESDRNADFVGRFGNRVWPTLWVIDPSRDVATLRWEGTATTPELLTLLGTVRSGAGAAATETTVAFLRANQAAARGDGAEAERGYRAILLAKDRSERPRAVEALVGLLATRKDHAACATLALEQAPQLEPSTSRATVLAMGLSCAREGKRVDDLTRLVKLTEQAANEPDPRMIADDRSALFEELVETKKERGDEAGASATARAWAAFLDGEAGRAPSKAARAVFDAHRVSAYLAMGEPARAIPMLEASKAINDTDYNPYARLARVHLTMNALDKAQREIEQACRLVYGPRSLRVFALAADIAKARGDRAAERAALEKAQSKTLEVVMNEGQKKLRAELERRLRDLPPP